MADTTSTPLSVFDAANALTQLNLPPRVKGQPSETQSDESEEELPEGEEAPDEDTEEEAEAEVDDDTEQVDDEEAGEEGDEEAADETDEEPLHEVKADGKTAKVTLDELKKSYSFTAHNTRTAQANAEKEKALESERTSVIDERKKYAESLTQLKEAIDSLTPAEPDWDKVLKDNPNEFAKLRAQWSVHKERMAKLEDEQSQALAKVQEDEKKSFETYLVSENEKLVTAIPTWKDSAVRSKEIAAMAEYAKSVGYTPEEISEVTDHRTVRLLRDAYLNAQAQKLRPAIQKRVAEIRSLTPGSSSSTPGRATVAAKAIQRLEKSGSVDDAVAALQAQRAMGGRKRR
jgi:hypothetical protein